MKPKETKKKNLSAEEILRGRVLGVESKIRAFRCDKHVVKCPNDGLCKSLGHNMYSVLAQPDSNPHLVGELVEKRCDSNVVTGKVTKCSRTSLTVKFEKDGEETFEMPDFEYEHNLLICKDRSEDTNSSLEVDVNDLSIQQLKDAIRTISQTTVKPLKKFTIAGKVNKASGDVVNVGENSIETLEQEERFDLADSGEVSQELRQTYLQSFLHVLNFGKTNVVDYVRTHYVQSDDATSALDKSLVAELKDVIRYRCPALWEDSEEERKAPSWKDSVGAESVRLLRRYVGLHFSWDWLVRKKIEKTKKSYILRLRKKYKRWIGKNIPEGATLESILTLFLKELRVFNWDVIDDVDVSGFNSERLESFVSNLTVPKLQNEVELRCGEIRKRQKKDELQKQLLELMKTSTEVVRNTQD